MDLRGMRIAVVGGATGGASAAMLLARAGAQVTLFEKVPTFRMVGAGIALQPNGLAVLYGLGMEAPLRKTGRVLESPRISDARGRTLFQPSMPKGPIEHMLMLRRSELQEILREAMAREPGIELQMGAAVEEAREDGTLRVDGRETSFDLIVGADGVHSRVRDGGDFGARVNRTGVHYARGLARAEGARNEDAWTSVGIFGSFPVRDGTYWYCSLDTPPLRDAVARRDLDALRAIWSRAYPASEPYLAELRHFDEMLINEMIRIDCERFFAGRLVLVGDAAHAMAPNLGQGANSALVDSAVLADELRRAPTLEAALAAYDRRRRPKVRWVQNASAVNGRISEKTGTLFRWMRDRLLMPLAGMGGSRQVLRLFQEDPAELLRIAAAGGNREAAPPLRQALSGS